MFQKVKLIPDLTKHNTLTLHPEQKKQLGIDYIQVIWMRFATKSAQLFIKTSTELNKHEMSLSFNVIKELRIPLSPIYEMKISEFELILGPYIGIAAAPTKEKLQESVHTLSNYLYDYHSIGGAVLAFSVEEVDMDNQLINGYIFNPETSKWDYGTYFYPAVIFRRVGMKREMRKHFHSLLGACIFNSYIFNKYEMYEWLSHFSDVQSFLPETILYTKLGDIHWFLESHSEVYIKPIYGSQGVGIIQVVKKGDCILVRYRLEGKNYEHYYWSKKEANLFFKKQLRKKKCIIQKAIHLFKEKNKVVDFRLILVKNQYGEWEDLGLVTRKGENGSIISNISADGQAEIAEFTLKDTFGLSEVEVNKLRTKMSKLAITAAHSLEKSGVHLGNLGIDLALDTNYKLWILEINNKDPNHTILMDAQAREKMYQAKRLNMMYAKHLAGFSDEVYSL
jgi:glutathione synthase/RimK-type ligase-like ATP-grasp enzyme